MSESHGVAIEHSPPVAARLDVPFEIRTKGISFRSFFSALEHLRGDEVVTRTIEQLPDDLQEAVMLRRIAATEWHPIAWFRELHRAVRRVTGEGPALCRELGFESVRQDFNGPLRALAFTLSPQGILRRGPRIFRTYYRPGEMYVLDAGPGRMRVHWSGCSGFDVNLWNDTLGGCESVLKVCGARAVDISVISGAGEHDSRAEAIARWS
ncbi:MAG TPA: hypothetical protein VK524_03275 [Polyangiaceae bacterium]|nr:hypothetical protein [Polyangiaceae bacterium]